MLKPSFSKKREFEKSNFFPRRVYTPNVQIFVFLYWSASRSLHDLVLKENPKT